jgi:hypothetical protein
MLKIEQFSLEVAMKAIILKPDSLHIGHPFLADWLGLSVISPVFHHKNIIPLLKIPEVPLFLDRLLAHI